jgi:hypothetical protein
LLERIESIPSPIETDKNLIIEKLRYLETIKCRQTITLEEINKGRKEYTLLFRSLLPVRPPPPPSSKKIIHIEI